MSREPERPESSLPCGMSDDELIEQTLSGRRESFDALVTRYRDRVYGLAFHMLWDEQEALDVAQEVFMRAFLALPRFRRESGFFTWLYRIAVNLVCTQARRRSRRRQIHELAHREMTTACVPHQPTPEDDAVASENRARIRQALPQIDSRLRVVLVLRDLLEMDVEEVAELLGIPHGTVKSRLFRARADLRRLLLQPAPIHKSRSET